MTHRGYKQTQEHIEKRKRVGEESKWWLGDAVSVRGGRTRALRMYPTNEPCSRCGHEKSVRHHIDGNTANNSTENIERLCVRCHALEHNFSVPEPARLMGVALAAELKKQKTHCPNGHPYEGENLYINKRGARVCKECTREAKRKYRARGGRG